MGQEHWHSAESAESDLKVCYGYDAQPKSSSIITIDAAGKKPGRDAWRSRMRFWKTGRAATTPQISTPLPALTSLRRLRLCGLFCGARPSENAGHGVVALVAGIFVDRLVALAHWNNRGERPRPYARIIDGELVHERVGVSAGEFLDEVQVRAGVRETRLALEVDRVDHQRVAFPVAPRIAPP